MTRHSYLSAFVIIVAMFAAIAPSRAETLSISATGLVLRCPCVSDAQDTAEESKGLFLAQKPQGRYFVPVVFPKTAGQKICTFSMVYQDTNAKDRIVARLFGKSYTVGGNAEGGRNAIAKLVSANGVVTTVRTATTSAISTPTINPNWFYYIEVDLTTVNLNLIGFQVEYKPTC
jgi:hypothetical protein